jgi:antitoxin component YwqK of YwqJK toxin-antitoxin module
MIRVLATALLALSLTASGAFATSWDDLVLVDGLYHKKLTDVPFTGKLDEGLERGAYKNGLSEGPWVGYRNNGQLSWKGAFKSGKAEGPWVSYYDNGRIWYKGVYKNGNREGPWVGYFENGTKDDRLTGTFRNDVKISD